MSQKLISTPVHEAGAMIKLGQLLKERKTQPRYGVFVFGLLEKPEEYEGFPCHGIYWLADVFNSAEEANVLVQEIMDQTGMKHVRVMKVGSSGLLRNAIQIEDTQECTEKVLRDVEKSNLKRSYQEKIREREIRDALEEEMCQKENPESDLYYAHVWLRYVQNRGIREKTQNELQKYQELEETRRDELRKIWKSHPEHEQTWLKTFGEFRKRTDEEHVSQLLEEAWIKYRQEVLPEAYS